MSLPVRQHGYMIKGQTGVVWGAGHHRHDGWALYKSKRNAELVAARYPGATVIAVTLTIEENLP